MQLFLNNGDCSFISFITPPPPTPPLIYLFYTPLFRKCNNVFCEESLRLQAPHIWNTVFFKRCRNNIYYILSYKTFCVLFTISAFAHRGGVVMTPLIYFFQTVCLEQWNVSLCRVFLMHLFPSFTQIIITTAAVKASSKSSGNVWGGWRNFKKNSLTSIESSKIMTVQPKFKC